MSDISRQEFQRRRQALVEQMQPGSAALIFAAPEVTRSADSEYPYRQNSDFWYFTGFNEPEAVLVLIKSDDTHNHSVLFNRVRDLTAEIWFGRRLGQDAAPEKLGVDRALAFSEINQQLYQLLNGLDVVYHAQGEYAYADEIVNSALEKLRKGSRQNLTAPATMIDWRPIVHEMRLFKSPEEIAVLRRAGEITALAHTRAMEKCRPGMFEYHLEGEIHHEFNRHGARYPSYNTIVGSGENGCILHYTENECEMRDGDLVLIDAGCEYKGYAGDITRTFPVNGKFTQAQREIYDIVLESLETSLRLYRPGTSILEVTGEVVRIMVSGLVKLGILKGDVDELIAQNAHRPFFMHGLSHWLGLDVIILPAPRRIAVFADERQRQAPVVAVVKMNFSRRCVFRLHLSGQLLHRQPALRKPRPAFTAHAVCPDFFLQPVQQPHQFSREHHAVAVLTPFLLERLCQAAPLRFFPLAVLCLDPDERREASRLVYRLDTCGVSLHRRQPVSVPAIPRHLRFTRQRHPPRQVTLPPPDPFCHSPSQRVVEVAALDQWLAMLYPRVEHQAVLAVVVVVVGPLVVRPYHTRRDAVRLLRQPAVFIVAVDIVRILRDAVIRPHCECTVRVQLRVRQPVARRVRGIRDADVQVWCEGAHTLQPARGAVAVFPRLSRAADAHQVAVVTHP